MPVPKRPCQGSCCPPGSWGWPSVANRFGPSKHYRRSTFQFAASPGYECPPPRQDTTTEVQVAFQCIYALLSPQVVLDSFNKRCACLPRLYSNVTWKDDAQERLLKHT